MPKVINITREMAKKWDTHRINCGFPDIGDCAWISISEPEQQDTIVSNLVLDKFPKLKIAFWDIIKVDFYTNPKYGIENEELSPPSYSDARQIVNFILKNEGRDFVINCAAGFSRSTAICQFCENILGYKWIEGDIKEHYGKTWSNPNPVLYQKMVDYYHYPILTYFSSVESPDLPQSGVIHLGNNTNEGGNL